jgi:hypothetical protein
VGTDLAIRAGNTYPPGTEMNDITGYLRRLRQAGYSVDKIPHGNHWAIRDGGRMVATCASTPGRSTLTHLRAHIKRWERQMETASV